MSATINIIITTRNFPPLGEDWSVGEKITFQKENLDYIKKVGEQNEDICIYNRCFGKYRVYVAPCLQSTVNNVERKQYLNEVIEKIFKSDSFGDSYLFAHDSDFDQSADGIIQPEIPLAGNNAPILEKFVEQQKVFLFQHDYTIEILSLTDKGNLFNDTHCDALISKYDKLKKELDSHMETNSLQDNIYPYPIKKVTR